MWLDACTFLLVYIAGSIYVQVIMSSLDLHIPTLIFVVTEVHICVPAYLGPLQIDFLFPVLAKQNLACGRALSKFHYSIMLTTTLARSLTQLQMLCTCLFTKLHGRE